ncbi:hypothetical protein RRG08_027531 [Elysia crispata]|uniref:Uncharacterized protein n=1 Tax=Elysia crispata TaxID=231223 RepID=A0AAE0YRF6_9GAST|nr:hypothetical protein RRG08_027531 [Elysia crispata]
MAVCKGVMSEDELWLYVNGVMSEDELSQQSSFSRWGQTSDLSTRLNQHQFRCHYIVSGDKLDTFDEPGPNHRDIIYDNIGSYLHFEHVGSTCT